MVEMGVKHCYERLPLVLFVLIKLLVLNFLCSVLHQTFFQCEKNLFSYLGRKRRLKWRVEKLRRKAANTNWSFLNALMIESLKGFSRFSKEAMEEGSKQELDSIKKGFLKSLNSDEDDEEKECAIAKYTDVKKAKKSSTVLHCIPFINTPGLTAIMRYCMIRKNKVMEKTWCQHWKSSGKIINPSTNPKPR